MTKDAPGERGSGKEPGVGASLRTFSLRVLAGTVLAALAVALALRWWSNGDRVRPPAGQLAAAPSGAGPRSARGVEVAAAPSPPAGERAGVRRREPPPRELSPPSTPVAREVERRRAAGALSEAHKVLDRCPGGDVRRLAWIDPRAGVVKLVREREDGVTLEEWFDDDGRLREARWQGRTAAGTWGRQLAIEAGGRETGEELAGGVVPDVPPPRLDRRDPTAAFFAGSACAR